MFCRDDLLIYSNKLKKKKEEERSAWECFAQFTNFRLSGKWLFVFKGYDICIPTKINMSRGNFD